MDANRTILTYLTTSAESQFVGQPVDIAAHWQGTENLLWRVVCAGRQSVLKLFIDAGQVRSRRQFEAQQLFYPAGFAARPLWYEWQPEGLTRPVLVYDWIEGEPLNTADHSIVTETAQILATVHAAGIDEVNRLSPNPVSLEYYWRLLNTSIAQINRWLEQNAVTSLRAEFKALSDAATDLAEQSLATLHATTPTAIHGDPRLENFIQFGNIVTLLDWERFGLGDPALEVATFLYQHQNELSERQQSMWLASYLSFSTQPQLSHQIEIYRSLIPFQSVCFLLDGLRELTANEEALSQHQDSLPFLKSTLAASLQQATNRLQLDLDINDTNVTDLFAQFGA